MKESRGIFVKVNYKNIGELNSFIYDSANKLDKHEDKYVMCAGKYDKSGWTIVFKAKNIYEAEELLNRNSRKRNQLITNQLTEENTVSIPAWMQ